MGIIIMVVMGAITAAWASHKGFNPGLWFLTAGCIGWIALAVLPSAKQESLSAAEQLTRKTRGDRVGGYLSSFCFLVLVFNVLAAVYSPDR